MESGIVAGPECVLFHNRFFPGWIPDEHVETATFTKEHFRERNRKMERLNGLQHLLCSTTYWVEGKPVQMFNPASSISEYRSAQLTIQSGSRQDIEQSSYGFSSS